jgi:hypothetical protein
MRDGVSHSTPGSEDCNLDGELLVSERGRSLIITIFPFSASIILVDGIAKNEMSYCQRVLQLKRGSTGKQPGQTASKILEPGFAGHR